VVDQWCYFIKNAHKVTLEDVKRIFPDPFFLEATGIMVMISQTPEQRMTYDDRLKFQRDGAPNWNRLATMEEKKASKKEKRKADFMALTNVGYASSVSRFSTD